MVERFERQADLVPREELQELSVTVIGVGAVGRQVALQMVAIGVRQIALIDFDVVEATNITTQGYRAGDIGWATVEATAAPLRQLDPDMEVRPVQDRFRPRHETGEAMFCCVDSISGHQARPQPPCLPLNAHLTESLRTVPTGYDVPQISWKRPVGPATIGRAELAAASQLHQLGNVGFSHPV